MWLAVSVLLVFGSCPVLCGLTTTIYITPTNATNPECPRDYPCVTLDHLAVFQLPKLSHTASVKLILLEGVHISTVMMEFVSIRHIVMTGPLSIVSDLEYPRTLIQLLSSNITVSETSSLEIKNLAVDGNSHSVLMMKKNSGSWSILFHQVTMLGIILQVLPLSNCVASKVNITSALFSMSRIEMNYGTYVICETENVQHASSSMVSFKSIRFLTKRRRQPNTIMICSPDYWESQLLRVELDNVTVIDLNDSLANTILLPYICDKPTSPSDIYVSSSDVEMTVTNSQFRGTHGTAIHAKNLHFKIVNCTFSGYTLGALVFDDAFRLFLLIDNTVVVNNMIKAGGLAAAGLMVSSSGTIAITNCLFYGNVDLNGNSQIIKLMGVNQAKVHNSKFMGNNGTVINAEHTTLTFSGMVTFEGNSAHQGGALYLSSILKVLITIAEHTTVNFHQNSATQFGGAIYIDYSLFVMQSENIPSTNTWCFYGPLNDTSSFTNVTLNFRGNSAGKGGDHIYGDSVKSYCKLNTVMVDKDLPWRHVFRIEPYTTLSPVTSKALRACVCDHEGQPQCADELRIFVTNHKVVYPGEVFSISAVIVGAEFGTTIGEVYANLLPRSSISSTASLGDSKEHVQRISSNDHCTSLNYSLRSRNSYEILYLTLTDEALSYYGDTNGVRKVIEMYRNTDIIPPSLLKAPIFINITLLLPCPLGFTLVGEPPYCDCYPQLRQNKITCTILNGTGYIYRQGSNWIGSGVSGKSVAFNNRCTLDHCKQEKELVDLETDPDIQCNFNHSGTLCGGCKEGYSVAIGSSHCLYCPDNNNALLFLFIISAGPLLYVLIAALDLTITKGAVNGLLFYANIVWIYKDILFPSNKIGISSKLYRVTGVFKVFTSWLNLDFGIEMCFIKGLDAFWKSMLQYAFPIYIWIIGYVVVVVYRRTNFRHCFTRLSWLLGNPTDVLVTFLLLSYSKLARTVIDAFGFAILTNYPDNSTKVVWALDGTVNYFKGKHIVLFILAMFALIATLFLSMYISIIGLKNYVVTCKCMTGQVNDQRFAQIEEEHGEEDGNHGQQFAHNQRWKATCKAHVHKCKSIFDMPLPLYDALFTSYDDKHRYWLGLMLFVRLALLTTFATTSEVAPGLNLLVLIVTATVLLLYMAWNNVYNDQHVRMQEGLALGNVIFFGSGIIYANFTNNHTWNSTIACISVGVAFIQFLEIIVHQFIQYWFKKRKRASRLQQNLAQAAVPMDQASSHRPREQLRESLLDNYNDASSECEPLIAHAPSKRKFNCLCCCGI